MISITQDYNQSSGSVGCRLEGLRVGVPKSLHLKLYWQISILGAPNVTGANVQENEEIPTS